MTLSESLLWSLARSVFVASAAIGPLRIVLRHLASRRTEGSRRLWLLLSIFPFFVPELLIGFNYRLTAAQLSSQASPLEAAAATELLYAILQLTRCLSVGVAVSLLLPPTAITAESLYSWDLQRSSMRYVAWKKGWLAMRCCGPWSSLIFSWSLMSLITFQEFETAALMQIDRHPVAWSVWLFDAHAARQPLWDSLRMTAGPVLCELLLMAPSCLLLVCSRSLFRGGALVTETARADLVFPRRKDRLRATLCVLPGVCFFLLWPMLTNARATFTGLVSLSQSPSTFLQSTQQILTSLVFAAGATILVMPQVDFMLAVIAARTSHRFPVEVTAPVSSPVMRTFGRLFALLILLPGLMGSLVCSLLLLAFFQLPGVRIFYDSWVPMLLGQTLAVLPKAALAAALLQKSFEGSAVCCATLLQSSNIRRVRAAASGIIWRLTTGRWLLAGFVISHWCFWDVTVASILRPIQLEPVVTRLYNEMHYGRTEALMSLACFAAITPGAAWLLVMIMSRLRAIRHHRSGR